MQQQLAALQKGLQQAAQAASAGVRAAEDTSTALRARCAVLERSAADLQTQLRAALEATSKLRLVPQEVVAAADSGRRLAESECAQLQAELSALYSLAPRVTSGASAAAAAARGGEAARQDGVSEGAPAAAPGTRVLHLISNPTSKLLRDADDKQRELAAALKAEAAGLREQLATAAAQVSSSSVVLASLQAQLKSRERDRDELQRLLDATREVASKSASEAAAATAAAAAATAAAARAQQLTEYDAVAAAADVAVAASGATAAASAAAAAPGAQSDAKKSERLLQLFKVKINDFKDAVKIITGWQVDLATVP